MSLGRSAILAACCVLVAALFWILALSASWASECPPDVSYGNGYEPTGLDKAPTLWPPGADCGRGTHEALPWVAPVIVGLVLVGAVAMLIAAIVQARASVKLGS